jgi:hypothetical protein
MVLYCFYGCEIQTSKVKESFGLCFYRVCTRAYFYILGRLVQRHENSETWQRLLHETDREDLAEICCAFE